MSLRSLEMWLLTIAVAATVLWVYGMTQHHTQALLRALSEVSASL